MDRNAFDGLTKLLAQSPSRRAALGALIGAGVAGALGSANAAKKNRAKKDRPKKRKSRKGKGKGAAQVSAQAADCLSPGPSSNMNNCPFQGSDFSGDDLSGSSMVGTNFTNAELVGTKLHSSNMKNAAFRGADLCGADLSSSTLRGADFRGFDPLTGGRPTNLTKADLSSSGGCGTVLTNEFTILCGTTWCDGSVRNDSCPGADPADLCCGCAAGRCCAAGTCSPGGSFSQCGTNGAPCAACATGEVCAAGGGCEACAGQPGDTDYCTPSPAERCGPSCSCMRRVGAAGAACVSHAGAFCGENAPICASDADCVHPVIDLRCVQVGTVGTCGSCNGGVGCVPVCPGASARRAAADPGAPTIAVVD